ncbi:MAG: hypothetical protein H7Z73_03905 [Candidatus Saccharibacteria bacterium]|nr:hypothetical protein [Moraxellaceae bacterium]
MIEDNQSFSQDDLKRAKRDHLLIAVGALLVISGLWLGYFVGHRQGMSLIGASSGELDKLRTQIDQKQQTIETLTRTLSNTVQERDIALTTSKGLTDSLAKSSADRELIDGQMKAYRDRLLGFGGISLTLQVVNILPISPSVFEYNIDLMQLRQKASASRGTFSIRLIQEGKVVEVPLANNKVEITDFQRLTGRWTMPAGFTPEFIEVAANAGGQSTIQRFAWERGAPLKNMPQMSIPDALANKSAS